MTVFDLCESLGAKQLTSLDLASKNVEGCYIGDLLSWVMGRAQKNDAWITIMSNINITAVAALADVACVILAEGVNLEEPVLQKANAQGIIVLSSEKSSYELACAIYDLL